MEFISALNIVSRLPPAQIDEVVAGLSMKFLDTFTHSCSSDAIAPQLRDFLMSRLDCRLHVLSDESTGKPFIASDFSRIGQSYRSPWSNVYLPNPREAEEMYFPPEELRRIEQAFNELLLSYCYLYYDNAVGSAYLSEAVENSSVFYGVIQIKKESNDINTESLCWESNHSFSVSTKVEHEFLQVDCAMASSVLVIFDFSDDQLPCNLNGSTTRSSTRSFTLIGKEVSLFEELLVRNIGEMVEENESSIRGNMDKVAIPRCTELAIASFGISAETDEEMSDNSSDAAEDDYRPRVSLGSMNPLHRPLARSTPAAFQADLLGAIMQRRLREDMAEGS